MDSSKLVSLSEKALKKNKGFPLQIKIVSDKLDLNFTYPPQSDIELFHCASIGKLLTTSLCLKLEHEGRFNLQAPLSDFFTAKQLSGIFLSDIQSIRLEDCLTHRSGAADFFEGKEKTETFIQKVLTHPDQTWTAEDLLKYVKTNMKPHSMVHEQFHYGDTAFLLVILALEKTLNQAFEAIIEKELFKPLGMKYTQARMYRHPINNQLKPQHIYLENVDVVNFESLSCDQADGGIISTPNDLILFQKALMSGQIIPFESLKRMQTWQGKFRTGIHYGMGMMQIRFNEFFPLMMNYPKPVGHIGILATHLYTIEEWDMHIVLNFGNSKHMTQSFTFLSQMVGLLKAQLKKEF